MYFVNRESLYIGSGTVTKFDRGSVEAAPDSLPASSFSSFSSSQALTRISAELEEAKPQFYRGNIEIGSETDLAGETPQKLLYYGAAKTFNKEEEEEEEVGETYQPLRQAVESRPSYGRSLELPEIRDMEDLREHFQSQHGQTFHQSRQGGHSRTYAKYQGTQSLSQLLQTKSSPL